MAAAGIKLRPLETSVGLKDRVYGALRGAITSMDIYSGDEPPRLDERSLAEELGVSRTPIREALSRLAQEGLVEMVPRKGAFVVRKNKREILEIISVWAALESMAARLATQVATDEEIGQLRRLFVTFEDPNGPQAHIDEYSDTNIQFHQRIISLSKNAPLSRWPMPCSYTCARSERKLSRSVIEPIARLSIICTLSKQSKRGIPNSPKGWCASTRSDSPITSTTTSPT